MKKGKWAIVWGILVLAVAAVAAFAAPELALADDGTVPVYRLYNRNDGQHLYTTSLAEEKSLQNAGWQFEGVSWRAPRSSGTPVYRLYNPNNGDHLYTTDRAEYDRLPAGGWRQENVQFYSDDSRSYPVYRLYNPGITYNGGVGNHLWTTDRNEYDTLPRSTSWRQEQIAWYGLRPTAEDNSVFAAMARNYVMASGIGAWGSELTVYPDGTFAGSFHDSNMGERGPGYVATVLMSNCTGSFSAPVKVDQYTYRTSVANIRYEKTPDTAQIIDRVRYEYMDFYGLGDARTVYFYLPGKPMSSIPSDCESWFYLIRREWGNMRTLPGHVIYNETEGLALMS